MFNSINKYLSNRKNNKIIDEITNKYLGKINELENEVETLSKIEIQSKIQDLRNTYSKSDLIKLNEEDLCLICAITREVAKRTISLRLYDNQIIGGLALFYGFIAEMKTGEGKTLVATLPVVLNFVLNKKVHLITVNDYLAKRDSIWMGPIYEYLKIINNFIQGEQSTEEKVSSYNSDVVYGNNNEFCFDYLRDNLRNLNLPKVQKKLNIAIIDEADSVLIDESRSPLGISGPVKTPIELFKLCYEITDDLNSR
jgi:preprotein translocase subunit SecA